MKKIKLIKIVVAVVTALVFCIALAVPCFADSPTESTDYVINTITFTDGNAAYRWFSENNESVVRVIAGISPVPMSISFNSFLTYTDDSGAFIDFVGSSFLFSNVVDLGYGSDEIRTQGLTFRLSADSICFTVIPIEMNFVDGSYPSISDVILYEVSNDSWGDTLGVYMTVEYTTEYVPKENTTRSGMYGQLYNILRDAIFGKDVPLDDSQDFVLTQISTWMTYIVILLPILVVGFILFRMFCR